MNIAVKEVFLTATIGCIPTFVVKYFEGMNELKSFVSSSIVAGYLFYYFLVFFAIHLTLCVVYWLFGWRLDKKHQIRTKGKIIYIGEVADGLLGIYRLITGLLFSIPIIWKLTEPSTLLNHQFIDLVGIALSFQVGVIAISSINALAKSKL
jgi:hypothetical protein